MRRKSLTRFALVASALAAMFVSGCVATWDYTKEPVVSANKSYTVSVPNGWACLSNDGQGNILATRDGVSLQLIRVSSVDISKDLPFAKEKIAAGMNAEQLVDVYYKDVFNNPDNQAVKMERAGPAKLGGVDGFELVFSYTVEGGLHYREYTTGAVKAGKLVTVTFKAPTRYYYDRDDDVIPSTLASFRFN